MGSLHDQESAIADLMEVLEDHRANCERLGKYMEADIARKRMDELKGHEEARRKEAMRARQLAEVLAVEEGHMLEFQQFNAMWDAKMQAYETNGAQLMQAMKERHADELRDFQQKLVAKATTTRHSREYYNQREVQERLAHAKNYAAAAKIKEKADVLMAFEEEKWGNERHQEMLHKENVFKARLAMEADGLRKRVAQGRAEQNRARQLALEKMLQCVGKRMEAARHTHIHPSLSPCLSLTRTPFPPGAYTGGITIPRRKWNKRTGLAWQSLRRRACSRPRNRRGGGAHSWCILLRTSFVY